MSRPKEGKPLVLAYVTLTDCNVTMMTNIVTDDPDALRVGQSVRVVFAPGNDDMVVPMFAPVA